MKRSIKNKDRKQIWMDHLQSWSKGKINQKDYCLKNKLTQSHFSYWKKALNISSIKRVGRNYWMLLIWLFQIIVALRILTSKLSFPITLNFKLTMALIPCILKPWLIALRDNYVS